MALTYEKEIKVLSKSVICEEAYATIKAIYISKNKALILVEEYEDSTKNNILNIKEHTFNTFNIEDTSLYKQVYEYLKTLEEFKDSEDC